MFIMASRRTDQQESTVYALVNSRKDSKQGKISYFIVQMETAEKGDG